MASERDAWGVHTVLRGTQLRQAIEACGTPARAMVPEEVTAAPRAAPGVGTGKMINGVPASAAMHCCGRGCAHCRIYWRKHDA